MILCKKSYFALLILFFLSTLSCSGGEPNSDSADTEPVDITSPEPEPEIEPQPDIPDAPDTDPPPCLSIDLKEVYNGPAPGTCPEGWEHHVLTCSDDLEKCETVCETVCSEICEEADAQIIYQGPQPGDCAEGYTHLAQNCAFDEEACTSTCNSSCEFQNTPKGFSSGSDPNFDLDIFNQKMAEGIFGRVKGYAYALSNDEGNRAAWGYGGVASEAAEPNGFYPYNLESKQNWASVSKFISAVTLLHAIYQAPADVDALLDSKMKDYLPYRWSQNLHPDFEAVTIRLLLQHKTGLNKPGEIIDNNVGDLSERLAAGPETDLGVGFRHYSNATGILEHMVVAYLTDPQAMDLAEALLQFLPNTEYDIAINQVAAGVYADYAYAEILPPANMVGSCDNSDFWDGNFAWLYASPTSGDGIAPRENQGGDHTDECSAGGWVTDASSLQKLLATIKYTENIFPQSVYALMENPVGYVKLSNQSGGEINALGYSRYVETEDGLCYCHGGDLLNGHSTICSFPNGYQVSFVVNSSGAQGDSIYSFPLRAVLVEAYNAAHN